MSENIPKKLSAIIACYRDAPAVPIMYERLVRTFHKINVDYEIIFVNDASPDNAREVLYELARQDKKVIVINHARNFGSQNAFTSGMKVATGDAVILLDGDLQDPPELIEDFYHKWREGYDVVYGERIQREATLFLQIAYKTFYRIFQKLSYVRVPLDAGDFSLLDRRVVDAINQMPESNRFIRGLRAWVGFKQIGIPYKRPERMFGRTTNSFIKNFRWAQKGIFSFSYVPLDMITLLALVMVALSIIGIVWAVISKILIPDIAPHGITTLMILIMFIGGVQLLCFSIIGTYLSHIYDEVKHRPPYIVESVWNLPAESANESSEFNGIATARADDEIASSEEMVTIAALSERAGG